MADVRKPKRRRKKRVKKGFKIGVLLVILLVLAASAGYKKYLERQKPQPSYGGISQEPSIEETITPGVIEDIGFEEASYTVINVGDGEAIFIKVGDTDFLIDTGAVTSTKSLIDYLDANITGDLDYVILTSDSMKRLGNVGTVYTRYNVLHTVIGELGEKRQDVDALIGKNGKIIEGEDMAIDIKDGTILYIYKPGVSSGDIRNKSLMTCFQCGDVRFVSESDAGIEEESKLIGLLNSCAVQVLARHGSDESNAIARSLNAKYYIASTGETSGLPSPALLPSYKRGSLYSTATTGTMTFTTDGRSIVPDFDTKSAINQGS